MIRAFRESDLDAAAALLAQRHERHRADEPLLPAAIDFRTEIGELWAKESASGAFADGGYVLGWSNPAERWGPNVWIEAAGHAADDPELVRDLYAYAAAGWVEQGLKTHYAVVPASDRALVDAWFRLGFGAQQAYGIRELPDVEWPANVRRATRDDVEQLVALAPTLQEHQGLSPAFSSVPPQDDDEVRADIVDELDSDHGVNLVVEAAGRVVGNFFVCPAELSDTHRGLARDEPARLALLASARLPHELPAASPADRLMPRIPLLAGSKIAVVNARDDAVVLAPPPPREPVADVGAAVRDSLRFP